MPSEHCVRVGNTADFAEGRPRSITVHGRAVLVLRCEGDRFYALRDLCPHHGAPLSAGVVGGTRQVEASGAIVVRRRGEIVRCPWHGWQFDVRTGCSLHDPAGARVARLDVVVEDGGVFVIDPRRPAASRT